MYKLRAELRAHSADVRGVAASPDGVIATASRDNTIIIWDTNSIEPVHILRDHQHFVNDLIFHTRSILVSASADKTLRIWDTNTGQCINILKGHQASVCAVANMSEGRVASASWDGTVRVWNVEKAVCDAVLGGHDGAVWGVASFPDGRIVTAGADKTVRIWNHSHTESAVLSGVHTDVIRAVVVGVKGGFVTVANDSTMVHWEDRGTGFMEGKKLMDLHDASYIYSLDAAQLNVGTWTLVSGGEDNAVRVVEMDFNDVTQMACVQTIMHPGTVWSACLCPGGDLVSACSDGVARVFTKDPEVMADPDVVAAFEKSVAERQVNTKVIGGVDVNKLPEAEAALAVPGKKDGENKIVKTAGGAAEVYMWSAAEARWSKVGEVVDNPSGVAGAGGGSIDGKTYDFVFEVEVGEGGRKEKLGFNRGENPYLAAQRFIDDNELSQEFLDQIAQFIEQQVPKDALVSQNSAASDPLTGGSRYVPSGGSGSGRTNGDPLTGGSRYIPGNAAQPGATGGDPLTGASRYVPGGSSAPPNKLPPPRKLIPHKNGVVLYKSSDQLPKIQSKLSEFNAEFARAGSPFALSVEEAGVFGRSLIPKLSARGDAVVLLDDAECEVVGKLLKWPTSHAFPALDIARLVVSIPSGCAFFFGKENGAALGDVLRHLENPDAAASVYIMGCRFLCNMFGNRVSGTVAQKEVQQILGSCAGASRSANRRARETFASVVINYAVSLHDGKASVEERKMVMKRAIEVLEGGEQDEEVVYRMMLAIGTLMCGGDEFGTMGMEMGAVGAAAKAAPVSARVQQVALDIATIIAT
eukprot:GFKZ01012830.1.p1 GENE.GFKZ01012830.1~~GFKZ01012830.1.p1  ORF type:complete len:860 (+),score=128.80 GFKZ01012830.1:155-2581(+)